MRVGGTPPPSHRSSSRAPCTSSHTGLFSCLEYGRVSLYVAPVVRNWRRGGFSQVSARHDVHRLTGFQGKRLHLHASGDRHLFDPGRDLQASGRDLSAGLRRDDPLLGLCTFRDCAGCAYQGRPEDHGDNQETVASDPARRVAADPDRHGDHVFHLGRARPFASDSGGDASLRCPPVHAASRRARRLAAMAGNLRRSRRRASDSEARRRLVRPDLPLAARGGSAVCALCHRHAARQPAVRR